MTPNQTRGFTLIELMIVVVIIGILAAIAIPNFLSMRNRANEAGTKSNMHTFLLAAEDYSVQHDASYAATAAEVAALIPAVATTFLNPFNKTDPSWLDQAAWAVPLSTGSAVRGVIAYGDENQLRYQIAGRGTNGDFALVLTSGQ